MTTFGIRNRWSVPRVDLPDLAPEEFRRAVLDATGGGGRFVAYFGMPEGAQHVRLYAVVEDARSRLAATSMRVLDRFPSLAAENPAAARFECEIAEQCGLVPSGHPALAPVRRHPPDHLPSGRAGPASFDRNAHRFEAFESLEVHEVAVGPVHAGIIEPGHFRFKAYGEEVLKLEIVLGYQHRGVERLLETLPSGEGVRVAEAIAGDTVIGHAEAYCGAYEALARTRKSPRAQAIRGIALELERLANHLGDLGAMAGDIAFQPPAAFLGRLRGECLNLLMELSGNRYGRGLVRPGGVLFDITGPMAEEARGRLETLRDELGPVLDLLFDHAMVQARFEGVGTIHPDWCQAQGIVGPAARACGVMRDVRHDHPYGIYRFAHIPVATAWAGDVLARALVRRLETQRSLEFLIERIRTLPRGDLRVPCGIPRPDELVVVLTEGWRGEIAHVVISDAGGQVARHKVVDPSFHNWPALAEAMPGNQISDFPLCNKSFNLSYAGHDL